VRVRESERESERERKNARDRERESTRARDLSSLTVSLMFDPIADRRRNGSKEEHAAGTHNRIVLVPGCAGCLTGDVKGKALARSRGSKMERAYNEPAAQV